MTCTDHISSNTGGKLIIKNSCNNSVFLSFRREMHISTVQPRMFCMNHIVQFALFPVCSSIPFAYRFSGRCRDGSIDILSHVEKKYISSFKFSHV